MEPKMPLQLNDKLKVTSIIKKDPKEDWMIHLANLIKRQKANKSSAGIMFELEDLEDLYESVVLRKK